VTFTWWTAARIGAAAALLQALLLMVAAGVAWVQTREARRLRKAQAQPYVLVSLESEPQSPHLVNLIIQNYGSTAARDISVRFEPQLRSSLETAGGERADEWSALKQGVPTLVPGQRLSHLFDSLISRYSNSALQSKYTATVRYKGDGGRRPQDYEYKYELDFGIWRGGHYVGRKTQDDMVKALEGISSTLKNASTSSGLQVVTFDGKALERERLRHWNLRFASDEHDAGSMSEE